MSDAKFKIEPESSYADDVVQAFDTLAHSDLRLDVIAGGIELRRSHYERLERTVQDV